MSVCCCCQIFSPRISVAEESRGSAPGLKSTQIIRDSCSTKVHLLDCQWNHPRGSRLLCSSWYANQIVELLRITRFIVESVESMLIMISSDSPLVKHDLVKLTSISADYVVSVCACVKQRAVCPGEHPSMHFIQLSGAFSQMQCRQK